MPPPPPPPPSFLKKLVTSGITRAINKDAQYRWDLLVSDYIAAIVGGDTFQVRGVVLGPVLLSAFQVSAANNDGITYQENDAVLLPVQATSSEDGPYIVGPVVAGTATLTRPFWWATGATINSGTDIRVGSEGGRFGDTVWYVGRTLASIVVDTDVPTMFPRYFKGQCTLVNGTVTFGPGSPSTPAPIINGFSQVYVTPITENVPNDTIRYVVPGATISPGPIGTGQFVARAERADGTVNVADQSVLSFLVVNDGGS
jgi:hypothetical protein